jgi:hypothetical protein
LEWLQAQSPESSASSDRNCGNRVEWPIESLALPPAHVLVVVTELIAHEKRLATLQSYVPMRMARDPMAASARRQQARLSDVIEGVAAKALAESIVLILGMAYSIEDWSVVGDNYDMTAGFVLLEFK